MNAAAFDLGMLQPPEKHLGMVVLFDPERFIRQRFDRLLHGGMNRSALRRNAADAAEVGNRKFIFMKFGIGRSDFGDEVKDNFLLRGGEIKA